MLLLAHYIEVDKCSGMTSDVAMVIYRRGGLYMFFKPLSKYGIEVHCKSGKTIKDELVAPKDKDHITKKVG